MVKPVPKPLVEEKRHPIKERENDVPHKPGGASLEVNEILTGNMVDTCPTHMKMDGSQEPLTTPFLVLPE